MLDNQPRRAINVPALCRDVHKEGGAVRRGGVTTLTLLSSYTTLISIANRHVNNRIVACTEEVPCWILVKDIMKEFKI